MSRDNSIIKAITQAGITAKKHLNGRFSQPL